MTFLSGSAARHASRAAGNSEAGMFSLLPAATIGIMARRHGPPGQTSVRRKGSFTPLPSSFDLTHPPNQEYVMVPTARVMIRAAAVVGGIVLSASLALGQTNVPIDNSSLALSASTSTLAPIGAPKGQVQVIVRLSDPSLAAAVGPNAKRTGISWSGNQQRAYLAQLKSKQDAVMAQVAAMGGVELARVSKAHNAVVVQIDAQRLPDVARLPGVTKVRPVIDYEAALSDTVPYIGATALQNLGITGTGTKVAVLDTGIDYTHYNLGGPGTTTAYF